MLTEQELLREASRHGHATWLPNANLMSRYGPLNSLPSLSRHSNSARSNSGSASAQVIEVPLPSLAGSYRGNPDRRRSSCIALTLYSVQPIL